jgi:hypothetical protein
MLNFMLPARIAAYSCRHIKDHLVAGVFAGDAGILHEPTDVLNLPCVHRVAVLCNTHT